MSGHSHLRVRFYPGHDEWTCVVQRLGGDGMPLVPDVVEAKGLTKAAAIHAALEGTTDVDVQDALREMTPGVH